MKILFISGFYPEIGGPFQSTLQLAKKITEKGIKVEVLSPIPKGYNKNKLDFLNKMPFSVDYVEEIPRIFMPSFSLQFFKKIEEKHKEFDLIHFTGIFDFYSLPLTGLRDTKIIYSPRGTFMRDAYKLKLFKKIKKDLYMSLIGRKILSKASIIHLTAEKEREDFLYFFPKLFEKTHVVPNGIDLREYEEPINKKELIDKYPFLSGKKIILYLGRINWKKGLDILVKCFVKLKKIRNDVHLIIAGSDDGDGYENKVRSWIEKYNLKNAVTFTGFLTGKDKLMALKSCDIFVSPSYSENFGVAIIEAMACGVPVVISNKVGLYKEVERNNAGIVVDTEVESVYKGIQLLLESESLRNELSANGLIFVRENYDIDKVADKMIKLYMDCLKDARY